MANEIVGRFAPAPTGPLHLGSLVAAVGSYLFARSAGGRWLVRIEDLDTLRAVPGADGEILEALDRYGLVWDGDPQYQSRRTSLYDAALARLRASQSVFDCSAPVRICNAPGPLLSQRIRAGSSTPERAGMGCQRGRRRERFDFASTGRSLHSTTWFMDASRKSFHRSPAISSSSARTASSHISWQLSSMMPNRASRRLFAGLTC
jgi:tRNA synthetases class I (E and Q), catalytic domain